MMPADPEVKGAIDQEDLPRLPDIIQIPQAVQSRLIAFAPFKAGLVSPEVEQPFDRQRLAVLVEIWDADGWLAALPAITDPLFLEEGYLQFQRLGQGGHGHPRRGYRGFGMPRNRGLTPGRFLFVNTGGAFS